MNVLLRTASLGALSLFLLSGCQSAKDKAMCPTASILASTSALTAFKPGMQGDPAGELYTVQITGVQVSCSFDRDEGTTDSNLDISFRATRAPSGDGANYTAPFYVASLLTGTTIVGKQILATAFSFAPGEATTTFTQNVPSTVIKFDNGRKPYEYGLLVGLQITREQLDYNKKTGRYTP
ncbi:MAG TPA: hypothetical protein VNU97_08660 [Rhizomicrobium sp.]|jgi:hypothetical protein|nr:hypothetical protein [Rhizomicrobium sp.]